MNQINVVTIGKLIEAHRDSDEQKFKTYVEFIAEAYEQQGNDRGARIIRNSYTGGGKDTAKVILDAASPDEQDVAVYYETVTMSWMSWVPVGLIMVSLRQTPPLRPCADLIPMPPTISSA